MPERSNSAGDSIAPQATVTLGASTVQRGRRAVLVGDRRLDADRAAVLDEDALGAAADDEARAGVGGVLQERLHRRLLAPFWQPAKQ